LHAALWHTYEEAGREGLRSQLEGCLCFSPSSEVGRCADGADAALRTLITEGLLREEGTGLDARLVVDEDRLVARRRRLLTLDPERVWLVQRGGERWAAFAATCSKYVDAAPRSPASMVASGAA
jgi:hypothetical protein